MKNILFFCCIILTTACHHHFLDNTDNMEHQVFYDPGKIHLNNETDYYEYEINTIHIGDAEYSIGHFPKWIKMRYMKGTFKDGNETLKFDIQKMHLPSQAGAHESLINLVIDNVGIYTIPVHYVIEE